MYHYFPRLKERRTSQAGYTSGGEQQMCAIGRALMAKPSMILLDEPSMGIAPQIVEEIFDIVKDLNQKEGVSFLLAEQNTTVALRYADFGYILENGRVVMEGAAERTGQQRRRQGVLPRRVRRGAQELPRHEILPPPQTLAGLKESSDMDFESAKALCRTFPGATEDIKWGADLVFSVGEKMFAVTGDEVRPRA